MAARASGGACSPGTRAALPQHVGGGEPDLAALLDLARPGRRIAEQSDDVVPGIARPVVVAQPG